MVKQTVFMKKVTELKAWELYTGQSVWFFFIGVVLFLMRYILNKTPLLNNSSFNSGYGIVEKIAAGQALPQDGAMFAKSFLD
tara:strand:+ start:221 stop:466 length:246 start_codon:yes stop_codon:yes gene_type:complete